MGMVFELIATPVHTYRTIVAHSKTLGLKTASTDEKILASFYKIKEANPDWATDTDKSWDMILACFSDGANRHASTSILSASLLGEDLLGKKASIHGLRPRLVKRVAAALEDYDAANVAKIIPSLDRDEVYCVTGDEDIPYVTENIEALRKFYTKAASDNRSVIAVLNA